jgi:tetratricopeptide (TPR) repeat protein
MPRSPWLAAVLLLSLSARPGAAQAPLAWRWQEKDQFYVEWTAHISTAHKTAAEEKWPAFVEESTRAVFRVTVLKRLPDGGVELELVLEATESDTLPGRLNPQVMEGLPVRARLGPQMQILDLRGLEAVVQKRFGEGALPPQAKTFRALVEEVWREWLQSVFFPVPGVAAPGARWEQETEKALPPLGRHVLRKTFVHEGKAAGGGRELARVTATGASTLVPYKEGELDTPHKVTGAHFKMAEYGGAFLFDPAAGRLVQGQGKLHTHLSAVLTVDGLDGEREATQDQRIEVRVLDQKPAAQAAAPAPVPADAPCRRLLTGEDARRAAGWEKRIADLTEAGLWGEALPLARQLAGLRRRLQGDAHWQAADAVRNVQTLEKLVALPEADRAEFLALPRLLARAAELRAKGKHAEGAALADKAWASRCRILGEEHHSTPRLYDELAANFSAQGKHAEAQALGEKSLELCRRVLGEEHPDTARAYHNVGCQLLAQGKAREAEPLLRQGLAIRLRVLGEGSADTARSYDNLAVSLNDQDRSAEAEPLHEKALAIARRALGEDDADTVQCGYNLAVNLLTLNRPAQAEPLLRRALEFRQRNLGEEHLATALNYSILAASLLRQDRGREAEPLLRRSLEVHRRLLGEANIETLRTCAQLGHLLRALGREREGQELLRRAEELFRRSQGGQ